MQRLGPSDAEPFGELRGAEGLYRPKSRLALRWGGFVGYLQVGSMALGGGFWGIYLQPA